MLQTKTVSKSTLELLKNVMQLPELQNFFLVGGTNLSLKLGHRLSVDLDLFTDKPFDSDKIREVIERRFTDVVITTHNESTILGYIQKVKVDVVLYRYGMINPIETQDEVRFASIPDIIAMKLNAISRRGAKKDFWDIAELLDTYTLEQMIAFFKEKHSTTDIGHIVRSLIYFVDADKNEDPHPLKKITWKKVKEKIETAVRKYIDEQMKN